MSIVSLRSFTSPRLVAGLVTSLALTGLMDRTGFAATVVWSGASTPDLNWSTPGNWSGGVLPGADDVKFFDAGAVAVVSNLNNVVDVSFGVGSLAYGNTNSFHTTLISSDATLAVTNASGMFVGTPGTASPSSQQVNATITGAGALSVSNLGANLVVNQGASANGTQRATLDLTGLDNFDAAVRNVFVGSTGAGTIPTANGAAVTGTLLLAKTNTIKAVFSPADVHSTSCGIDVGYNGAGTQGGTDFLYLGQMNTINVDTIAIGRCKGVGVMTFAPQFAASSPTAVFRGTNGGSTRVSYWTVGDQGPRGSGSGVALGTNDFTAGTLDALVDRLVLGQDPFNGGSATYYGGASSGNWGVFAFNTGTLNVNTLTLGNISSTWTNKNPSIGILRINGNGTLRVNNVLQMAYTVTNTSPGTAAANTYGQLGITNATAFINSITVASNTTSANNRLSLRTATMIVSNAFATSAYPLTNLFMADSVLGLKLTSDAAAKVFVGNLTTGGATNQIQLDAPPVFFASYPTQFALVKFAAQNANNFGLVNLPGWAAGAMLVSNGVTKSLDLVLPVDPRPVISSQPNTYSGSPGDNVVFNVALSEGSVQPLSYQWYKDGIALTDGATGNGATVSGVTTASLTINNAQTGDSASAPGYAVVVTNAYGAATSAAAVLTISAGSIAPTITGPNDLTVIQTSNATFTATVAGNPTPTIQWRRAGVDLLGENASTYTLLNAQYPTDDGAVFSIVASNSAGSVTNSATLTVIVPPTISAQPADTVVTNTQAASFAVTAAGVPAPTYQWYFNNAPINGATAATLNLATAAPTNIGSYYVVVQNAAGSVTSSNATLTVNSVMSVTGRTPASGATGICYDTPLALTFDRVPALRKAGQIRIYNVLNPATPVDTIDLSQSVDNGTSASNSQLNNAQNVQPRNIGGDTFTNFPVIITGTTAAIYPHLGVMTSNQTYYVTVGAGCFADTNGAYFVGITNAGDWQFTTKPTGPANSTNLIVAADGSGDFVTVQGAVDSIPANNTTYTLVNLRNGTYPEIVNIKAKHNLTFRGETRNNARIAYANNNNVYANSHFCMTFKVNANDIAIDNLTITNTTPQGGSQAFALMVETGAKRLICNNSEISSYQDTILVNTSDSTAYFRDSLIQGDVDYIWGGGNCFFTNCEMRTLRATGGYVTQARTAANSNGMSFVKCSFTVPGPGYVNSLFGRAINTQNGNVALINCRIDASAYTGWNAADVANASLNLRWWESSNSNLTATAAVAFNGTPIGVTNNDPRLIAAQDAVLWLNGWTPQLAPNIVSGPTNQSVTAGATATFTVVATGIPDTAYQWLFYGTNLSGANGATLTIPNAQAADSGPYAVIVSNASGSTTSGAATLTVNAPANAAPVFVSPIANTNIAVNVGVNLAVTNVATDADVPAQTLTFTLLAAPANATLGSANGILVWRPLVSQRDSTNVITVQVEDSGSPSLSATQSFTVVVNPLSQAVVANALYSGGVFSAVIQGDAGPDYAVRASTNLVDWEVIFSTNSPAMPFNWSDPDTGSYPQRFYQILVGPPLP